ncbi:MAG TPA: bifunctional diaminohydroxyphosphoribosylaminopyrimidine deaminase/5-amino-6-(5-phosphoribosylamino)uracil reductase RibD [Thermodesulfobacteriota bacterium]|nr:bifunctional diaminohydroxyphosphoribosylaminopyrimidine deaminase/5-amino-6-(5-phosphoribosylamino)uracil reductase RibD [Thermodesulfobacteriota bacterium]
MPKDLDSKYMSLALRLAKKAEGMTSPNPLVGAVIVKNGEIVGKGYHKKAGLPHAEIEAFLDAERNRHDLKGSALYVTLEPCCHTEKRTPPCVNAILEKNVSRVVVGTLDLNPAVSGNGVKALREKGIEVKAGVLEEKCREINEPFFKYVTTRTPFVILKLAATLDGKIATFTGDSKWIGSGAQRRESHLLRNKVDAVLVGIETVMRDNPQLTVRLGKKSNRQPTPVVLDSKLRISLDAQLLQVHESPVIVTTQFADPNKVRELERKGARVLTVSLEEGGRVDLEVLTRKLGQIKVTSVLVEGGGETAASFIKRGLVDKVVFFYAPKIVGADGVSMIGKLGIPTINDALPVKRLRVKTIGEELIVEGYMK